jgi:hypothetical protein
VVVTAPITALSTKLIIDSKSEGVLFSEAGKDVVDFLFSMLALPAATAVKLLGAESMAGSFGSLYSSVEKLDSTYLLPGASKDALLRPTAVTTNSSLLLPAPASEQPKTFYRCDNTYSSCRTYITDVYGKACPQCGHQMTKASLYLTSAGSGGSGAVTPQSTGKGFVQGIVTYTVLDDLTVSPMSATSSITLLNAFTVTDVRADRLRRGDSIDS